MVPQHACLRALWDGLERRIQHVVVDLAAEVADEDVEMRAAVIPLALLECPVYPDLLVFNKDSLSTLQSRIKLQRQPVVQKKMHLTIQDAAIEALQREVSGPVVQIADKAVARGRTRRLIPHNFHIRYRAQGPKNSLQHLLLHRCGSGSHCVGYILSTSIQSEEITCVQVAHIHRGGLLLRCHNCRSSQQPASVAAQLEDSSLQSSC